MYNQQFEKDLEKYGSFRQEDWNIDKAEIEKVFNEYKSNIIEKPRESEPIFNFQSNLIDMLYPFVNKRKVRSRLFKGSEHEVKLVRLEEIPGSAKLIYRNLDRCVGAMVDAYINSVESAEKDLIASSKKLYKKAKKL